MRSRHLVWAAAAAFVGLLTLAPFARATFHDMSIREVYPGSLAAPDSGYVELQMYASGQNLVGGHGLTVYDDSGSEIETFAFTAKVANGANQQTILIGDDGVDDAFGVTPDLVDNDFALDPDGGAACWAEAIDCVAWGDFSDPTPPAVGSPADPAGIPDGVALLRSIAPGCPTLLQASDDHDDSATDFAGAAPAPRPNSVAPSEQACASQGGGGGGGEGGPGQGKGNAGGRPETILGRHPGRKTRDRTPSFRFTSNRRDAVFLCRLDSKPFKACRSPFTASRLKLGRHVFQVKAKVRGEGADRSPASWAFKVVPAVK